MFGLDIISNFMLQTYNDELYVWVRENIFSFESMPMTSAFNQDFCKTCRTALRQLLLLLVVSCCKHIFLSVIAFLTLRH